MKLSHRQHVMAATSLAAGITALFVYAVFRFGVFEVVEVNPTLLERVEYIEGKEVSRERLHVKKLECPISGKDTSSIWIKE